MRLFSFPPFKPQYYFPGDYKEYPFLSSFYKPYTFAGQLLWIAWHNITPLRRIFEDENADLKLPVDIILNNTSIDSVMAFNLGSPGPEQKITVLGVEPSTGDKYFIKYASSETAKHNVNNEAKTLRQLKHLKNVPVVLSHIVAEKYSLVKTTVLEGLRIPECPPDDRLLELLIILSEQKVTSDNKYGYQIRTCFAHGDFCPWNMMEHDNKLKLYDWEMSGYYPLGYDLFTYIFQTSFLLHPNAEILVVLNKNVEFIHKYFRHFNIVDYRPFLLAFAELKVEFDSTKSNLKLNKSYKKLKEYASKI